MTTLQEGIIAQLTANCRVILIANADLSSREIHTLGISASDVVIQFNKCIHARRLAEYKCKKIFVFSHNHLDSAFGFAENGEPEDEVIFVLGNKSDIDLIAFTYRLPETIAFWLEKYEVICPRVVLVESATEFLKYPASKLPSVGFLTFSMLNGPIRTQCSAENLNFFIYCVGFKGRVYCEGEMVFHDFIFERNAILRSDAFLHSCFDRQ